MLRQMLRPDVGEIIPGADVVDRHLSLANEFADVEEPQSDVLRVKIFLQTMLRHMLRPDIGEIFLGADVVDRHLSLANEFAGVEEPQSDVLRARAVRAVPDHM